MKTPYRYSIFLFILIICSCTSSTKSISERDSLLYENTKAKYIELNKRFRSGELIKGTDEYSEFESEVSALRYSFELNNMSEEYANKSAELKSDIDLFKKYVLSGDIIDNETTTDNTNGSNYAFLVKKQDVLLSSTQRHPFYLYRGDKLYLSAKSNKNFDIRLYNADSQEEIAKWKSSMNDTINISNDAIYLLEIKASKGLYIDYSISYNSSKSKLPSVSETQEECAKKDFLAREVDAIDMIKIFEEPYKIGLRGQLKAAFSGNMRSIVSIQVPKGCKEVLYSLSISTNERTQQNHKGDFDERLRTYYKRIKILGKTIYEKETSSDLIDGLLFNTRPAREEDAFCNMYVFTNRSDAKRFQDSKEGAKNFAYDVDNSRMGTHSCNGRLNNIKSNVVYMGFENERVRYDNFISLEVVGVKSVKKYFRPVYSVNL